MNTKQLIISIVIGLVLMAAMFFLGRCTAPSPEEKIEFKSDTILVEKWDTVKLRDVVYKDRIVLDSVYVHDTILVREQLEYSDSLCHIWVSGIQPEIDSIEHFIKNDTVIINNETTITKVESKKMGFGLTLGAYGGYGGYYNPYNGNVGLAPEIGIGVAIGWTFMIK